MWDQGVRDPLTEGHRLLAVAVAVAVADKAGGRLLSIVLSWFCTLSLLFLPGKFSLNVLALDADSLSLLPELGVPSLCLPQSEWLNVSLLMCWVS